MSAKRKERIGNVGRDEFFTADGADATDIGKRDAGFISRVGEEDGLKGTPGQ
jgi:hypothetical protein